MATLSKVLLSGSTNGKPIKVVAVATLGTTVHTAIAGTSSVDYVTLWAYNGHTADVVLTLEWGGATVPDQNLVQTVTVKSGAFKLTEDFPLQNGLVITAFASVANVITIQGSVTRVV